MLQLLVSSAIQSESPTSERGEMELITTPIHSITLYSHLNMTSADITSIVLPGCAWNSTKASVGFKLDPCILIVKRCNFPSSLPNGNWQALGHWRYMDKPSSINVPRRRCITNREMGKMLTGDVPPGPRPGHSPASGGGWDASEPDGSAALVKSG